MAYLDWDLLPAPIQQIKTLDALADPRKFFFDKYFVSTPPHPHQMETIELFYSNPEIYELIMIIGRGAGKTWLGGFFTCYETFKLLAKKNPALYFGFPDGEEIRLVNLAKSGTQAKATIFSKTKNMIERSPYFQAHHNTKKDCMSELIKFPNECVFIENMSSSSASGRGRTTKMVMFDELAFFQEGESDECAWPVYTAMKPGCARFHDFDDKGYILSIGSVNHERDILMELYRRALQDSTMMAIKQPTWSYYPEKYPEGCKYLEDEKRKDPVMFAREYGCIPYQSEQQMFAIRELTMQIWDKERANWLEEVVMGNTALKVPRKLYCLSMDPGDRVDAFGLGISHYEHLNRTVHDGLWRLTPKDDQTEIDPFYLRDLVKDIYRVFRFGWAVMDISMFKQTRAMMKGWGVKFLGKEDVKVDADPFKPRKVKKKKGEVDLHVLKKEDWDFYKEAVYDNRVEAAHYPIAVREINELVLERGIKVNHPPGGTKDVADTMCNGHWAVQLAMPRPNPIGPLIVGYSNSNDQRRIQAGGMIGFNDIGRSI